MTNLNQTKLRVHETGSSRLYTDEYLSEIIEMFGGDPDATFYEDASWDYPGCFHYILMDKSLSMAVSARAGDGISADSRMAARMYRMEALKYLKVGRGGITYDVDYVEARNEAAEEEIS